MALSDDLVLALPLDHRPAPINVLDFDGTDGCVRIDSAKGLFSVASDFSVSLRFKADSTTGSDTRTLVAATTSSADRFAAIVRYDSVRIGVHNASGEVMLAIGFTDLASWHFLEISYTSATHTLAVSLDGVAMTLDNLNAYPSSVVGCSIGAKTDGSANYFDGTMSQVFVRDSAGSIMAQWNMEEGSGATAYDAHDNTYAGTHSGEVAYAEDVNLPVSQRHLVGWGLSGSAITPADPGYPGQDCLGFALVHSGYGNTLGITTVESTLSRVNNHHVCPEVGWAIPYLSQFMPRHGKGSQGGTPNAIKFTNGPTLRSWRQVAAITGEATTRHLWS